MNHTEIENYIGSKLPQEYFDELKSDTKYKIEYKEWTLFPEEELVKEINLSGNKMPQYKILEGHFNDSEGFSFPNRTKLKTALAISYENGDILFFDKKLHIYIFFLSSQEVIKVANSFAELSKFKVIPEVYEEVSPPDIHGLWVPESSSTENSFLLKRVYPSYRFLVDGKGFKKKKEIIWRAIKNSNDQRYCLLIDDQDKVYISNLTESTFLYTNKDQTVKINYKKIEA